jgi:excisionase family DNA binding protein
MKQPTEQRERLFTKKEAANHLTVCVRTIENLMAARQLGYIRIGRAVRLERAEIERFKKTFTVQAAD